VLTRSSEDSASSPTTAFMACTSRPMAHPRVQLHPRAARRSIHGRKDDEARVMAVNGSTCWYCRWSVCCKLKQKDARC